MGTGVIVIRPADVLVLVVSQHDTSAYLIKALVLGVSRSHGGVGGFEEVHFGWWLGKESLDV